MLTVSDFLGNSDEEIVAMNCHNCLSLVPFSRVPLMNNFIFYNPAVDMNRECQAKQDSNYEDKEEKFLDESSDYLDEVLESETSSCEQLVTLLIESNMEPEAAAIETQKKRGRKRKLETPSPEVQFELIPEHKIKTEKPSIDYSTIKNEIKTEAKYGVPTYDQMKPEEYEWIRQQISASKIHANLFQCSQCNQQLRSQAAIRYHVYNKHLLKHNTIKHTKERAINNKWVAAKIKESKHIVRSSDGTLSNMIWKCVECSKTLNSAQSIRYHLHQHLKTDPERDA